MLRAQAQQVERLYQRLELLTRSCFPKPGGICVHGTRSIREDGMVAVGVKRTDFTAASLRAAAVCADDPAVTRRALAIAMVLDGYSRATAAELAGMDRQTLRDWVHRFNAEAWKDCQIVSGLAAPPFCQSSR